mmetsp:Transcript_23902/g.57643  ORF Transcript_23902/g.57643 Transcript_23902/m.57643 type:complete len:206 (-) Transcript_23902:359-976(-)
MYRQPNSDYRPYHHRKSSRSEFPRRSRYHQKSRHTQPHSLPRPSHPRGRRRHRASTASSPRRIVPPRTVRHSRWDHWMRWDPWSLWASCWAGPMVPRKESPTARWILKATSMAWSSAFRSVRTMSWAREKCWARAWVSMMVPWKSRAIRSDGRMMWARRRVPYWDLRKWRAHRSEATMAVLTTWDRNWAWRSARSTGRGRRSASL